MSVHIRGPWSQTQITAHLDGSVIPLRLAWLAASGFPWVSSLWFLPQEGALWCASPSAAAVVRGLRREPRCGFEVASEEPPYCGVRGRGRAMLVPERGEAVLRALIQRYLGSEDGPLAGWLLSRADREVAIRITPDRLASFDYRERMGRG
jgi:hypothetical protein